MLAYLSTDVLKEEKETFIEFRNVTLFRLAAGQQINLLVTLIHI
jgi:hypothetical protein